MLACLKDKLVILGLRMDQSCILMAERSFKEMNYQVLLNEPLSIVSQDVQKSYV